MAACTSSTAAPATPPAASPCSGAPGSAPAAGGDLGVDRIVRAAIDVADTDGLAALSMRRVAERLGVGTMSLYTHVPGKGELLDLMLDTVHGETPRPADVPGGWRDRLERIARDNWALYLRHRWLLQVATTRPPLGPHVTARYDYELRAIEGIGLTDLEMDAVITLVDSYVHGAARGAVEAAQATAAHRTHRRAVVAGPRPLPGKGDGPGAGSPRRPGRRHRRPGIPGRHRPDPRLRVRTGPGPRRHRRPGGRPVTPAGEPPVTDGPIAFRA